MGMQHERFMRLALEEARRAFNATSPNPRVGALVVRGGRVLAAGYHRRAGLPHAEVEALRALPEPGKARGATLYVTLEPCSTHGRTPPCVEAILAAGLRRVVVGAVDPNPAHAGRGLKLLRAAGVEVVSGVLAGECSALNPGFNQWVVHGRPWVIAKAGMSLDGRLTRPPGEGRWITSAESRADAMGLRARVDAVLIGANTLRHDNPKLTIRGIRGPVQPWRVVLAGEGRIPRGGHLFTDAHRKRTLVYRRQTVGAVLAELGKRGVTSVLIEGGSRVLGAALDARLVDEVRLYLAPMLCGGAAPAFGGLGVAASAQAARVVDPVYMRIGDDLCCSGLLKYPA
jgi:diaminohydroxyphosphoribosylaminopyrimidine deaminase/5-amino-6-(5-phosphoribosylamino)uracil reductase